MDFSTIKEVCFNSNVTNIFHPIFPKNSHKIFEKRRKFLIYNFLSVVKKTKNKNCYLKLFMVTFFIVLGKNGLEAVPGIQFYYKVTNRDNSYQHAPVSDNNKYGTL